MKLSWINLSKTPMPQKYLHERLIQTITRLKCKGHGDDLHKKELVIVFVERKRGRELNRQFRQKDYPTDVLSFSGGGELLGELILCAPVCKQQAQEHKLSYRDECLYLTIHGILHLLGYEHEEDEIDAEKMYALQDELFERARK